MSHTREVVDAVIANSVKTEYKFSQSQLGFQLLTSLETAIFQHIDVTKQFQTTPILGQCAA